MSCLMCESQKELNLKGFDISIYEDEMQVAYTNPKSGRSNVFIQISFCPFCGQGLPLEEDLNV